MTINTLIATITCQELYQLGINTLLRNIMKGLSLIAILNRVLQKTRID